MISYESRRERRKVAWIRLSIVLLFLVFWVATYFFFMIQFWITISNESFGIRAMDGYIVVQGVYNTGSPSRARVVIVHNADMRGGVMQDFTRGNSPSTRVSFPGVVFLRGETLDRLWWHSPAFPPVVPGRICKATLLSVSCWMLALLTAGVLFCPAIIRYYFQRLNSTKGNGVANP